MEYFNKYSDAYINTLKTGNARYKLRLELLSDDEYVVGDITKDVSLSALLVLQYLSVLWMPLLHYP